MRLVALTFTALYFFACSPITAKSSDAGAAADADTSDGSAGGADASNIAAGALGGACLADLTCNGNLNCNAEQVCVEPPQCMPSNIVYLNRDGGTYTPGSDDSRTNTSSILSADKTVSARTISTVEWNQLLTDTRQTLAAYDIAVVDVDPGNVPHLEIVLTDMTGNQFGISGALGISPGCSDDISLIAFMFGGTAGVPLKDLVASRIGLTLGLSYSTECSDLMTWDLGCFGSTFSDVSLLCGQDQATTCRCDTTGETKQNSHQSMLLKLGASSCL
jgi:hypothetical protein